MEPVALPAKARKRRKAADRWVEDLAGAFRPLTDRDVALVRRVSAIEYQRGYNTASYTKRQRKAAA
jgi:hypothetical protein